MDCPGCGGAGKVVCFPSIVTCGQCGGTGIARCERDVHVDARPMAIHCRFVLVGGGEFAKRTYLCSKCDEQLRPLTTDGVIEFVWTVRP